MSQTIIGLDLGSYSIKAVMLRSTFKRHELAAFAEEELPSSSSLPWDEKLAEAWRSILRRFAVSPDQVICSVPGDKVTLKELSLPFADPKKIEQVIGFELEGDIPFQDIDEVFFDYQVIRTPEGESSVTVALTPRDYFHELFEALKGAGMDARIITVAGMSYPALLEHYPSFENRPLVVVDIGHETTRIVVCHRGRVVLWRTLLRGGRSITRTISRAFNLQFHEAEGVKRSQGQVRTNPAAAVDDGIVHLPGVIEEALAPIVREIRVICIACEGKTGAEPARVFITGGTSRIKGIDGFMGTMLGLPVERLKPDRVEFNQSIPVEGAEDVMGEALATSLRAFPEKYKEINFRKGPYAFKGHYQYIRERALGMAACLLMLIASLVALAWSRSEALQYEHDLQTTDLKMKTRAIFGEEISDFEAVLSKMRPDKGGPSLASLIPAVDGFEIFSEISSRMGQDMTVDMETIEVDLERKRVEIRGRTESATSVETIAERLRKYDCFPEIVKDRNEKSTDGKQLFVLAIELDCGGKAKKGKKGGNSE